MTKLELNRDIKRMLKAYKNLRKAHDTGKIDIDRYFKIIRETISPEWFRLYHADLELKVMSANSIRIMVRMNLTHKFKETHLFGIHITL